MSDTTKWGVIVAITLVMGVLLRLYAAQQQKKHAHQKETNGTPSRKMWISRGLILLSLAIALAILLIMRGA